MCGRFTLHTDVDALAGRFEIATSLFPEWSARYNIAPTQWVAAVRPAAEPGESGRVLEPLRWGLVPFWAKDPAIGSRLINARSETVAEKPSFKNSLARRRCLILADGFYEWEKATRTPTHFRRKDGAAFAFAGLFDEWQSPEGGPWRTCTILTTGANDTVGAVHDRMPVILSGPDAEAAWLDTAGVRAPDLAPLFAPLSDDLMESFVVGKRVGSPAVDEPALLTPVA